MAQARVAPTTDEVVVCQIAAQVAAGLITIRDRQVIRNAHGKDVELQNIARVAVDMAWYLIEEVRRAPAPEQQKRGTL